MTEPPFYTTRTLLGFGGEDLNRVTLYMPDGSAFHLCDMGEPRTKAQEDRWRKLAVTLSKLWEAKR